jgi:predicted enzyme related to lactoylglutathione lyase
MSEESPVSELRLALTVDDYDKAMAFWHQALGLPVSQSWGEGKARGAVLAAGKATIELLASDAAANADLVEVGRPLAQRVRLALEVADSGAAADRLAAAGAKKLGGLVETPWHHRNIRMQSPDGLQLTLFTVLDGAAHAK